MARFSHLTNLRIANSLVKKVIFAGLFLGVMASTAFAQSESTDKFHFDGSIFVETLPWNDNKQITNTNNQLEGAWVGSGGSLGLDFHFHSPLVRDFMALKYGFTFAMTSWHPDAPQSVLGQPRIYGSFDANLDFRISDKFSLYGGIGLQRVQSIEVYPTHAVFGVNVGAQVKLGKNNNWAIAVEARPATIQSGTTRSVFFSSPPGNGSISQTVTFNTANDLVPANFKFRLRFFLSAIADAINGRSASAYNKSTGNYAASNFKNPMHYAID